MKNSLAEASQATAAPFSPGAADVTPSPVRERIHALDVLRGVAVGGILFANVLVFFGLTFMPPDRMAALPTVAADNAALFLERVFVEGKFYSVFSLLFGIGFGLQLARGGDAALPRFKRRLRILLAIGAVHAFLIWAGDILMLYALLGFTMPWFARKSNRALVRWSVALLTVPTALYIVALAVSMLVGSGSAQTSPGSGVPPTILKFFEAMGRGGFKDALIGNLVFLAGRWADLIFTVRFPKVLAMFVLGLWTVRTGLALSPSSHRPTLVRWSMLGWGIGLPANIIAAWAFEHWPYLPPSIGGLLGVAMQAVGIPMLALGYATTIALLVADGRRSITVFAPVGRMAIAAAIILLQIPLSAWWLSRYRFGPVEWIWRRLTYARPI